ncbi:hypothetical protein DSO57_1006189 [Entomophthora muscae]|uniref:Uncharacterized protein n=1 Tax=Entomophthora muscae TaxID=34485 RepID=A0ACC2RMJ3_9FUNG|nr:hypothetical protein DSO57_1006189 [Entomophthora muscae]
MAIDQILFKKLASGHPKPAGVNFSYGTAGFRMKSEMLDSIMFRVGLIAALRSRKMDGQAIGVMVTASHNPAEDNGVKIVEPRGEMLDQAWEAHVTKFVNIEDDDQLLQAVEELSKNLGIDNSNPSKVVFGRDTRPSGPKLIESLVDGIKSLKSEYQDFDIKTTPQLHYIVRCLNTLGKPDAYGEPTEKGYYSKLAKAFKSLMKNKEKPSPLTVDCANGVGAPKLRDLAVALGDSLSIIIANDDVDSASKLNYQSGADFVKVNHQFPQNTVGKPQMRYCSLDGDADRIVYYYASPTGALKLLDGDKISGLAAMFLIDLVKQASLNLKVGVVQTAYANGSSTTYLRETLNVPVACAKTGVKHLHHEAEKFDIGVYFEANGHGTVLFSPVSLEKIHSAMNPTALQTLTPAQADAMASLGSVVDLINQTVGDALSDMLLVEVVLAHRGWSLEEWDAAYIDLPNRLAKVVVQDRTIFSTTDAERKLTHPEGLQTKIDALVSKYHSGRSFVRPSGTEDVVRVYAEAATRQECDDLALAVANLVHKEAGGKGEPLSSF